MLVNLVKLGIGFIFGWVFGRIIAVILVVAFLWLAISYGDRKPEFQARVDQQKEAYRVTQAKDHQVTGGWTSTASGIPYKIEGGRIYNGHLQVVGRYPEDFGAGKALDPSR